MGFALLAMILAAQQPAPDTVVVCPPEFRASLAPWLEYRAQQGHQIVLVSNLISQEQIREQIRAVAREKALRFIVLVGDADPRLYSDPAVRHRCVPTYYAKAKVNVLWGSEPYLATDNWYADLDDDQTPDVAIGRLSAATPAELSLIVGKILSYERSTDFGPWRRQVNLVAGVGGFGPLADFALEAATRYFVGHGIPDDYATSMTYASWHSPYCPDPRQFPATILERLNEGSLFWVYIGHGHHLGLDQFRTPAGVYPILTMAAPQAIRCRHAAPIALFLACYTGAFDAPDDCLAEQLVRSPGGPVAVVAGSRVTMPYAMAVMANELMTACFRRHVATLGEALLQAKQNMVREPRLDNLQRTTLDMLAAAISPAPSQLAAERAEHVLLFNLIGDPLMRLRYPQTVELQTVKSAAAGASIEVHGQSPVEGRCTVELAVPCGTLTFTPPPRSEFPRAAAELAAFQDVYRRANDSRLATAETQIAADGRFAVRLPIPAGAKGSCHVRVFVEGPGDFAMGSSDLEITRAEGKSE